MNRPKFLLLGFVVGAAMLVATFARPAGYVTASALQFDSMVTALQGHGVVLASLPPGQSMESAGFKPVGAGPAVDVAVAAYGKAAQPIVFEGTLTMADQEPSIDGRLVYAVQLTGLSLPPFGGNATQTDIHGELVVFVDATSGKQLLAITVR